MSILFTLLTAIAGIGHGDTETAWRLDAGDALGRWGPNAYIEDAVVRDGLLEFRASGPDPFFLLDYLDFEAKPNQYLVLSIAANATGQGAFYWTGSLEGQHGGLSERKRVNFQVSQSDAVQEVVILPFWQGEDRIRRMRLGLYDEASFRLKRLEVRELPVTPITAHAAPVWDFSNGLDTGWLALDPDARTQWAMLDGLNADAYGWFVARVEASQATMMELRWASRHGAGFEAVQTTVRPGSRWIQFELQGDPKWQGAIEAIGMALPPGLSVLEVRLSHEPAGPAQLEAAYFGPENGVNRAGQAATVLARIENEGGASSLATVVELEAAEGAILLGDKSQALPSLAPGDSADLRWKVQAASPGDYAITLTDGGVPIAEDALRILPAVDAIPSDYVPAPQPVETIVDVMAYYFPGWHSRTAWAPIEDMAPGRKPVLGWYDETSPEVVDWQIKWAVENGITGFLVDWYWVAGSQHLTHWFEAYREARYRDQLDVAIMWANHNPPGTHSQADWDAVTQEWLDHYFTLPTYYHLDGMPAVFIWSPQQIREDLGGSDEVALALGRSQEMAREAGYAGIAFVALFDHETASQASRLEHEGYHGVTNYHEKGNAAHLGDLPRYHRFADVVATAPAAWARRQERAGKLRYYPVADTGWDARPWHGGGSHVFDGRTPDLWRALLREAREFIEQYEISLLVLGPLNEWGEGSYIEPAVEYDFKMYEAVREMLGVGNPSTWPVNLAPHDVGLGPYDLPIPPLVSSWSFEEGAEGWVSMMGIASTTVEDGLLRIVSNSRDPALHGPLVSLDAKDFGAIEIRMRATGSPPDTNDQWQLFWSEGRETSEASSVRARITHDGEWHTYRVPLDAHPRWRGTITRLRFDPSIQPGITVEIDAIRFVPHGD